MRTYLVTGAAGHIGSHLCESLLADGHRVIGLDNFCDYYPLLQKKSNVVNLERHTNGELIEGDIRNAALLADLFKTYRPHAVAHLAAMANVRYAIDRAPLYTDVNIVGTVNVLEAAKQASCDHVVFASTSSIYGQTDQLPFTETNPTDAPLSAYPASKKACELMGYTYHNLHRMNFTALRFFSVYGPRARPDMMPFIVTDRIARGQTITLFNKGQMSRDWTYVDDIVTGIRLALDRPLGYEIINLGRGRPVLMAEFIATIENLIGKKAILETPPAPASEPITTFANIDKAKALLDYAPQTDIDTGLSRLWDWYQQRPTYQSKINAEANAVRS